MKTKRKKAAPKYRPVKLEMPYCKGLLTRANLISPDANGLTVMRTMLRLIRVPVVAKGRDAGLMVEDILQNLSVRTMQRIRKRVQVRA